MTQDVFTKDKNNTAITTSKLPNDRLKSLMNVEKALAKSRLIVFCTLLFSFLFCTVVVILAMQTVSKSKGKIFITNGYGNTLTAYQIAANKNRRAEAKAQVRDFHFLLYNITPNPKEVEKSLNSLLLLGDGSVKAFLDKRGDKYYKKLISQDVEIKYQSDSIKVNMEIYPYKAVQYGKEVIQSNAGLMIKNLLTSCELREIARTDENPHGLQVSNFQVLKNERLEFVEIKIK